MSSQIDAAAFLRAKGGATIEHERAMLMALLGELGPVAKVTGLDRLSGNEKTFLLTTCCAEIIAAALWTASKHDRALALVGLDGLVQGMVDRIKDRTSGP